MISALYVDDEQGLREAGKVFLERSGEFRIDLQESAADALTSLEKCPFDAIISDYMMPEMDGISFLKAVRQKYADIPFIIFTGKGREDVAIEAINYGADFYIKKGHDVTAQFAELAQKVRHAVDRHRALEGLKTAYVSASASREELQAACRQAETAVAELKHQYDELARDDEKIRMSEERFRLLLQNVPSIAIQGYTMDGITCYWNEASEKLYGYTAEEVRGKSLLNLIIPPEMQEEVKRSIEQMARTGHPIPAAELSLMRKDGSRVETFSHHALVRNSRGGLELFCIDIDLSDRKRVEEALRQAHKKLGLLASITRHDLKNQMTVLLTYIDLIERSLADPEIALYAERAQDAARQITSMIHFTEEYESIGMATPAWQDLREAVDRAAGLVHLGRISVYNNFSDNTEVFADPLIIKVFYNLLDNALRYGGDRLSAIRFFGESREGTYLIICEDDGEGVPAAEKDRIFDRRFGKNTGLGLALSREILSITGITIRETGEPGRGARFEMQVPGGTFRCGKNPDG